MRKSSQYFFRLCSGFILLAVSVVGFGEQAAKADELSEMISPLSHFVNFEDPRIQSEIRPIFAHHEIDDDFITQGGNVQLYAVQARLALTEDLAFIATKDGFIDLNPKALPDQTGWADIDLGFKYAFYQDAVAGEIFTGGLRYSIPVGDDDVFQGQGDGLFNPFISGAIAVDDWNFMAATGFRIPFDSDDSAFYDLDIHVDYEFGQFYPFLELGVITVVSEGDRLPETSEGQDLFNFGSNNSQGETLVTLTGGGRYRITDDIDFGAGVQFPLTSGAGSNIIDYRVYSDFIFRFDLLS